MIHVGGLEDVVYVINRNVITVCSHLFLHWPDDELQKYGQANVF